jgi:hypothetical protein
MPPFSVPPRNAFSIALLSFALAGACQAGPWAEADDWQLRHHLQTLRDAGLTQLPLSQWPLSWQAIDNSLKNLDTSRLQPEHRDALAYIKHALNQGQMGAMVQQKSSLATERGVLQGFSPDYHGDSEHLIAAELMGDRLALRAAATRSDDPLDDQTWRADSSYIAALWGNWSVGLGSINRWWGPGWQSSMILSDHARPTTGLFLQRMSSEPFSTEWLSWLGPWQVTTFMNQLASDRDVSKAKLWGLRFTHIPWTGLELGYSRAAIWGGAGRPDSLGTFKNVLLGKDNRGDSGIAEDASNEPGNQLAGIDWRLSLQHAGLQGAFYGQVVGEDESGGLPSRTIGLAGVEVALPVLGSNSRFVLEASNSTMRFASGTAIPNGAYEHALYTDGYRHKGRSLGASSDNDSDVYSLAGMHPIANGHAWRWRWLRGRINADGGNAAAPAGNPLSANKTSVQLLQASYQLPLSIHSQLTLGAHYVNDPIPARGAEFDSGGYIQLQSRW